jgi:hypothetical protein
MMKRLTLLACAFAVVACASGPRVDIIQPDVEMLQLVGPADLNYPRGLIEVQYALRITNRSSEPIQLTQIQLNPVGAGGPYSVARQTYRTPRDIAPNATVEVPFWARAYAQGDAFALDANAPVSVRAVAYFRSAAGGGFQKILMKTFGQQGTGPRPSQ